MKKLITSVVATGLMLGSTAAVAAPTIDREGAPVLNAEESGMSAGVIAALLAALAAVGLVILIEDNEDDNDPLPTSP
ncbi:hypothetical protein [Aurantiacibacter sediminis]|uniref:Ferrochelatase n=1 Tax=Aurantiacibacter sediminis TaxID=2793064 RepID=A0ABS0N3F5_9SPHN|nr:hypothetical protein [Aurantiacibacter sediminis]MBH5322505.1 hypothetical protein [Aurantiacibacter sediminis]